MIEWTAILLIAAACCLGWELFGKTGTRNRYKNRGEW
jgi:hypothetical protein